MSLTTQWSRIEEMQGEEAAAAWQWFVDRYRSFVEATLRRVIWAPERVHAAADEFWGYLFQHGLIARQHRGLRFRAFLVTTLRKYALDWLRRNRTGNGDAAPAERAGEPLPWPEEEEIASWSRHVVHLALQRLERDNPRHASVLRAFYGIGEESHEPPRPPQPASAIADEHGLSDNATHQLLFRARARLRTCIVEEVRHTVSSRGDLDAELELLTSALGKSIAGLM